MDVRRECLENVWRNGRIEMRICGVLVVLSRFIERLLCSAGRAAESREAVKLASADEQGRG